MNINIENINLDNITETPDSELFGKKIRFREHSKILLTGASGTGKTTFISVLYGLAGRFSGNIVFNKTNIKALKSRHWVILRQSSISIVFQDLRLFSELTGYENILIKNRLTGYKNQDEIESILNELGIRKTADKKISEMSFGEKQRFAIARALMQPFSWLILDEPFSHLDKKNRKAACGLIEEECGMRKAGIIIAEHDDDNLFDFDMRLNL
jgi:putative ABC transport system ATP-binding protein